MSHLYEVGQPYHPSRRRWEEGLVYQHRGGQHELLVFYADPTAAEVEAWRRGQLAIALVAYPSADEPIVLALAVRAGDGPWSDALFTWHLVPEDEQVLPAELGPGERPLLHVVLVDAATGLIRALRAVSLGSELAASLHEAICRQAALPWPGRAAYGAAISRLYAECPSSGDLVRRAVARWQTGRRGRE